MARCRGCSMDIKKTLERIGARHTRKGQMGNGVVIGGVIALLVLVIVLGLTGIVWIFYAAVGEKVITNVQTTLGNTSAYFNNSLTGVNSLSETQGDFIPLGALAAVISVIIAMLLSGAAAVFFLLGGLGMRR